VARGKGANEVTVMRNFESFRVGEVATLVRRIEACDVEAFVALTGDNNPLHVDAEFAKASPFKEIVVHGMLGAAFVSTLIGTKLPGPGALWLSQTFDFAAPIRVGDELTISCTVVAKHERDRLLDLEVVGTNQDRAPLFSGRGRVRVLESQMPTVVAVGGLSDPVTVVTGASGGIGQAVCLRLATTGGRVVGQFRRGRDRMKGLVEEVRRLGGELEPVEADFADAAAASQIVARATERFGRLDAVVHAASPRPVTITFDNLTWEDIQAQLTAQVASAFALVKAACSTFSPERGGRVVFVTTQAIDAVPTERWTSYLVAKGAMATLARSLARELGPRNITVNCVAPGMTDTMMVGNIPEKARLVLARQVPLRRLAQPVDIAEGIAFLLSPGAAYITGETLRINGGQVML
jgi:3-oxoacyl-[acyl-carrier protein] reductase